jgi:hypothetical protein
VRRRRQPPDPVRDFRSRNEANQIAADLVAKPSMDFSQRGQQQSEVGVMGHGAHAQDAHGAETICRRAWFSQPDAFVQPVAGHDHLMGERRNAGAQRSSRHAHDVGRANKIRHSCRFRG